MIGNLVTALLWLFGEAWVIDAVASCILWYRTSISDDLKRQVDIRFQQIQSDWDSIRKG